nr:hypothetical protein CFP56_68107 [Quercus suber]
MDEKRKRHVKCARPCKRPGGSLVAGGILPKTSALKSCTVTDWPRGLELAGVNPTTLQNYAPKSEHTMQLPASKERARARNKATAVPFRKIHFLLLTRRVMSMVHIRRNRLAAGGKREWVRGMKEDEAIQRLGQEKRGKGGAGGIVSLSLERKYFHRWQWTIVSNISMTSTSS